jgi:hypothetical protein
MYCRYVGLVPSFRQLELHLCVPSFVVAWGRTGEESEMKRAVSVVAVLALLGLGGLCVGSLLCGGRLRSPASIALAQPSCQCPEKQCANGKVAGCTVTCPAGQDAECACDGFCDDNGNPAGLNRCACQ